MADIYQLSNEEIRFQLQRFGYHVGPVTSSSRNVYIRRLQHLLSEKENKYTKSDASTRLSTLSSEEDTDEAATTSSNNRSGRKKRSIPHYASRNVSYRNTREAQSIKDPCIVNAFRVPVIRSARKSILDRGSGEVRERTQFRSRYADYPSGLESSESDEPDSRSGVQARKKLVLSDGRSIYHSRTADNRRKLLPSGSTSSRFLSSIRSVISSFGSLLTAFARRSRVSDSCIENNGYIPQPRIGNFERQGNRTLENFLTTEERNWFSRNCQVVPKTLVLIVMLFFLGLAVSYAALGRVKSFRSQTGNNYPVCGNTAANSSRCVQRAKLQAATNLVKIVTPLIEQKSEEYACKSLYGRVIPNETLLTDSTLLTYLKEKKHPYNQDDIKNMEVLISFNPHWGYTLNKTSEGEVLYLSTTRARITCYITYHISWFVNRMIEAAFCVMLIYVIFKLLSAYKAHAETHKRNVRAMVSRITKFIRTEFDNNTEEPVFVVVDYVRDQLIPTQDNKRLAMIWTSAVNFIRNHDPRIKEEQCVVNGELKTVWRWMPESGNASTEQSHEFSNSSQGCRSILSDETFSGGESISDEKLSRSNNNRSSKIWQGQAFETMAGSPNSVPCSPTPCLKIRHMFDPDAEHGEDWPTFIRDAILEKCEGVAILHLFVDKTSREGCVYVKCQTPEDAGRAYCALHGWWFGNSHLVTVKYLRIERYHERFPGAINAKTVLKPSNSQRLPLRD